MKPTNTLLIALLLLVLITAGCSRSRKQAYTSETYYERIDRWILPDKYTELIVAVPIEDKVAPAFLVTRALYKREESGKYAAVSVRTVNMAVYEAAEQRRQTLIANLFNFFRIMALAGVVACVAGLLLFALKFRFPAIPGAGFWDELMLYGGLVGAIGIAGAWYVEEVVYVGIIGAGLLLAAALYSGFKRYRQDVAIKDLVTTVEVIKSSAREAWDNTKSTIEQAPSTQALVTRLKPLVREELQATTE